MVGKGIAVSIAIGLALFAGAVLYAVHRPPNPEGFSGLTVAPLTPAAAAKPVRGTKSYLRFPVLRKTNLV